MNTIRKLILEVEGRGGKIEIAGDTIQLSGSDALPPEMVSKVQALKSEIMLEISGPWPWWCDPEELRAEYDEVAVIGTFNDGALREEAEQMAGAVLIALLTNRGLTRDYAEKLLAQARKTPPQIYR